MDKKEYISEVIGCFYTFKSTHILIGGTDDENRLQIHTEIVKTNCPIKEIAKFLKTYSLDIWINTHQPLRTAIGVWCKGELSFEKDNESENEALEDLFLSLKQSGRLSLATDVKIQGNNAHKCLKILLKALTRQLCQEPPEEFSPVMGGRREIYEILDYY